VAVLRLLWRLMCDCPNAEMSMYPGSENIWHSSIWTGGGTLWGLNYQIFNLFGNKHVIGGIDISGGIAGSL